MRWGFEDNFEKEIKRDNLTSISDEFEMLGCTCSMDAFEILTGELYFTDWISGMTLFISES